MTEITANSGLLFKTKVHVEDSGGNGRPVVLIHGWPLSSEAWKDNVPAIKDAGYRAVAYDRRGFGRSDKPKKGYDYDTFAEDLDGLLSELELTDVTLVGFSMGGGEIARYIAKYGEERVHSVVFAAAIPPYLQQTDDNPEGPLDAETAGGMEQGLKESRDAFFPEFVKSFYSAGDELKATETQVQEGVALANQSDQTAALGAMEAFGTTDFREDITKITVPTLVIHGDSDGIVPFEGSGKRTHEAIAGSELHVIDSGPHGINVTHADEFNRVLVDFLAR